MDGGDVSAREQGTRLVREVWIGPNGHENFAFRTPYDGEMQRSHGGPQHGRWFPEPVAARLIDPDDPEVRERIAEACVESIVHSWKSIDGIADAILDALRGAS